MKKKWLIIALILIVISVVLAIVFLNLFKDKNTEKVVSDIHSVATTGYLSGTNDDAENFESYLQDIKDLSEKLLKEEKKLSDKEKEELQQMFNITKNYKSAFEAYKFAIKYFDKQLVFTTYTDTYKANQKEIRDSLKDVSKTVKSISNDYGVDNSETLNIDWLKRTWSDWKDGVQNVINKTGDVYKRLFDVYESCLNSQIMNNNLINFVFSYLEEKIDILIATPNAENIGAVIESICTKYFSQQGEKIIIKYNFDISLQEKVADVVENEEKSDYWNDFLNGFSREGV